MNSICLPVPLVLLLRRLINAFSVFSISRNYLTSRWIASLEPRDTAGETAVTSPYTNEASPHVGQRESLGAPAELSWGVLKGLTCIPWLTGKALPPTHSNASIFPEKQEDWMAASRLPGSDTPSSKSGTSEPRSPIHRLISHPTLFSPVRAPRHPIVLCHGLYGFDVRGPEAFPKLRMHYWSNVLHVLRKKVGAEVVVTGVPGTGSIASRAERMDRFLRERVKGREINFLAHSMGGLDCRHLITHIQPEEYTPVSLTSLSVPHRGSPFMDWCLANIGIGSPRPFSFSSSSTKSDPPTSSATSELSDSLHRSTTNPLPYSLRSPLLKHPPRPPEDASSLAFALSVLPSSFTAPILSLVDSPAYSNLTTSFLRDKFNPHTPNKPGIKYFSVAARTTKMSIWHPLWLPKLIIDAAEEQEALAARQAPTTPQYPRESGATVSYPDINIGRDSDPEQGNDGLVTVSSAKWGEFLGTMEGADHWELRGARGLGADWDEGWGNAWREWIGKWRDNERELHRPARATEGTNEKKDWATRNDLATRFDLERFYVALSRKLYDEGL